MRGPDFALYTSNGWVNIPAIADIGGWCNIIIGSRQVGKTFGTLKYLCEQDSQFLYVRRTADELEAVAADPDLSPFKPLESVGIYVGMEKAGKIAYSIGEGDTNEKGMFHVEHKRGLAMALAKIASVRGFNGSAFDEMVFDEFIPERIVAKRKAEGEALLNAYVTVCGNRELQGRPPLRLWLLANAFDMASPVLQALGVLDEVTKLSRSNKEWTLTESGVFIAMPQSKAVIDKRKQTALMRHLATQEDGAFYQMAMENRFSYNNLGAIRPMRINGLEPLFVICGYYAYKVDEMHLYICRIKHQAREIYDNTPEDLEKFQNIRPYIKYMISLGQVWFSDAAALITVKIFLGLEV